jgi:hypothetical protein
MRLRPKRFRPFVSVKPPGAPASSRPIRLTLGPAFVFELDVTEARQLALALADAIEAVQRGRGGC